MKQRLLTFFCLGFLFCLRMGAWPIDSLFIHAPRQILSLLDQTAKFDLIDFYNEGLTAKVENLYGGVTVMVQKNEGFVRLQLSEVSDWTLKVFETEDGAPFLVCVHSVKANGRSATVRVYDMDWKEKKMEVPAPVMDQFMAMKRPYVTSKLQSFVTSLAYLSVDVQLNDSVQALRYELSAPEAFDTGSEALEDWIVPVVYTWNGKSFEAERAAAQP